MILTPFWITLITLITSQHVHSKVITINTTGGSDNTACCVDGNCTCTSLSTALLNMTSNTVINITSESVTLEGNIKMGSGDLNNITISGNGGTIMCNNSGGVYCESCDHVVIERITWDKCGDPNGAITAGVTFNGTTNIKLVNSTFQYSQAQAVWFYEVSGNITIMFTNFLSNHNNLTSIWTNNGGLSIERYKDHNDSVHLTICESTFYQNGYFGDTVKIGGAYGLSVVDKNSYAVWNIVITNTIFSANSQAASFFLSIRAVHTFELAGMIISNNFAMPSSKVAGIVFIIDTNDSNASLSVTRSVFEGNTGSLLWWSITANQVSFSLSDSHFVNNEATHGIEYAVKFAPTATAATVVSMYNVTFNSIHTANNPSSSIGGIVVMLLSGSVGATVLNMTKVSFQYSEFFGDKGGAVYINHNSGNTLLFSECEFVSSKSLGHGAALYIDGSYSSTIEIWNCTFEHNNLADTVVYVENQGSDTSTNVTVCSTQFSNNVGSSMYLSSVILYLCGNVLFVNNAADNGAALYLDQGTNVTFHSDVNILFANNSAELLGGAIFVDLLFNCPERGVTFSTLPSNTSIRFTNNKAGGISNSLYFNVPKYCHISADINDPDSIFYVPCQFNYSQIVNKTVTDIPCNFTYHRGFPISTSPHYLILYNENFKFLEVYKSYYCGGGIVLGQSMVVDGCTFNYFGKPAEPTQFNVECVDCFDNFVLHGNRFLIDNTTSMSIKFSGKAVENYTNVTLHFTSILYYYRQIKVKLVVELIPCLGHPGFVYSEVSKQCDCYDHDVVKCDDDYGEIKRGYWFGSVNGKVTTTLCPSQYCNFIKRLGTSKDYFRLFINDQCKHHRTGSACGECNSPGYTLAYDSTDCISVDHCSAGMTVLVVVLTCLYWIVVVVGVFSLMYFNFQISSGYVYGIIYYYSMVGILLSNNPYILDGAFQFINILSSFAQLTPRFLGQLCLTEGMSGIDQLFIHYSHALTVSLLLLVFVFAARYSPRVSLFISRCIIRVICLLLLLSYTSLASTSLQLLRPLTFTDINKVYTYSSPHVQYFHGRHMFYGIVAVICELVIGIGLPLFLLLEPLLSRKFNLVKIKPLLDQLQGCYKDKYRWFAAYYLICRQVIVLVMYTCNKDYYSLLFYLQTTCTIIAFIHIWVQPYKNDLLNALDGVVLLVMVSLINVATFTFLQPVVTEITLVLVILPLLLYCMVMVRRIILNCMFWKRFQRYHSLSYTEGDSSEVEETIRTNQEPAAEASKGYYSTFQESLLSLSANYD